MTEVITRARQGAKHGTSMTGCIYIGPVDTGPNDYLLKVTITALGKLEGSLSQCPTQILQKIYSPI